jgi:large subunit ribosomal protein L21
MYAVFVDGSRQYRVSEGDVVKVDYRDVQEGQRVEFPHVILFKKDGESAQIGQPALDGMRVLGQVDDQTTHKVYVQHFRRRKNYRRLRGHRQPFTLVRVTNILLAGQETPPPPTPPAAQNEPAPSESAPAQ